MHRGLLCHYSSYFETLLNDDFKVLVEEEILLAYEDPATFARFNEWLYTRDFCVGKNETRTDVPRTALVKLYIFAEKHGIIPLQNTVVSCLLEKYLDGQGLPITREDNVWNYIADPSPLRTLVEDLDVREANTAERLTGELNRSSLGSDLFVGSVLAHLVRSRGDLCNHHCDYHIHNERFPKQDCGRK